VEDRHLITVDELRAAGALDVPASWRKSLHVERDLFTGLFEDDVVGPSPGSTELAEVPTPLPRGEEGRNPAHSDAGSPDQRPTGVDPGASPPGLLE
jgi:hypothetical protein